jgi:hypothetical protein
MPRETNKPITSFKGFDNDFRCRGFQFEVGQTYTHPSAVKICASGFHACEYPLNVFKYYAPATSRFAEVEQTGKTERDNSDSKIASAKITIKAEITLSVMIERAVKWVFDRAKLEGEGSHATGLRGAASATGYSGAASATGDSGAASATGYSGAASATGPRGAASATGYSGAASATGDSGAASATGYSGAASATGPRGAAMSSGRWGQAKGAHDCALFLVYRDDNWNIKHAWAGIVGQNDIKPNTWYHLNENGHPCEVL